MLFKIVHYLDVSNVRHSSVNIHIHIHILKWTCSISI